MNQSALVFVLTLSVLGILMVLAMVRFSATIAAEPERQRALERWGTVYATTWCAIVVLVLRGAVAAGTPLAQAVAGVTLIAGGWATCQAAWVWLWLSLERTHVRATHVGAPSPFRDAIRRRAGSFAIGGLLAVALAIVQLGFVGTFAATMVAPGHRLISATLTVAIAGFVMLIVGAVRLTLSRGESMGHAEIEEELRSIKYGPQGRTGPPSYRRSTYRIFGSAKGAKAEQEVSIAVMKEAWRTGAWRRDPMWRTMFMMAAGGLMTAFGGFGSFVVAGPPIVKILCGGALFYATFQLVAGVSRA